MPRTDRPHKARRIVVQWLPGPPGQCIASVRISGTWETYGPGHWREVRQSLSADSWRGRWVEEDITAALREVGAPLGGRPKGKRDEVRRKPRKGR